MNIIGVTGQAGAGKDIVASRLVEKHGYVQLALADPIKRFGLNVFGFDTIQLWGPAKEIFDPMFTECSIRSSGMQFEPGCSLASAKRGASLGWSDAVTRLAEHAEEWVAELVPVEDRDEALKKLYFWFASLGHHYAELSPRIMLQHLGTEWGREVVSDSIWIDKLIIDAEAVLQGEAYTREEGVSVVEENSLPVGIVVSDVRFLNEVKVVHKAGGKIIRVERPSTDKRAKSIGIVGHASESEQAGFGTDKFDCLLTNDKTIKDLNKAVDVVAAAYNGLK